MKESKVITFIGGFYIFGGIIALLSLLFNGSQKRSCGSRRSGCVCRRKSSGQRRTDIYGRGVSEK